MGIAEQRAKQVSNAYADILDAEALINEGLDNVEKTWQTSEDARSGKIPFDQLPLPDYVAGKDQIEEARRLVNQYDGKGISDEEIYENEEIAANHATHEAAMRRYRVIHRKFAG